MVYTFNYKIQIYEIYHKNKTIKLTIYNVVYANTTSVKLNQ